MSEDTIEYTAPPTLAQTADKWFTLMHKRLDLNRQAAAIEKEEAFLKNHLIDNLPADKATGIAGKKVSVQIVRKDRFQAADWDAVQEYIAKNRKKGAFAILNRALNAKACAEYFDAGKTLPGVEKQQYKALKYSALGK